MMTIALHSRLIGRPGRLAGLKKYVSLTPVSPLLIFHFASRFLLTMPDSWSILLLKKVFG